MAKGEIACFDKFLLLLQCFQDSSAANVSKYCKSAADDSENISIITQKLSIHDGLFPEKSLKNIVAKGEIARFE